MFYPVLKFQDFLDYQSLKTCFRCTRSSWETTGWDLGLVLEGVGCVGTGLLYVVQAEPSVADVIWSFHVVRVECQAERFHCAWKITKYFLDLNFRIKIIYSLTHWYKLWGTSRWLIPLNLISFDLKHSE